MRGLVAAEFNAPTSMQGAFIAAGNPFDAMAAISQVLATASSSFLIVDPYMDEKALMSFAVLGPIGVRIQLLADDAHKKPSLKPTVLAWIAQKQAERPLEARVTAPRTLHDRLIMIDEQDVYVLTQSLNAFAARAPASIVKTDAETAMLKVDAYKALWAGAGAL